MGGCARLNRLSPCQRVHRERRHGLRRSPCASPIVPFPSSRWTSAARRFCAVDVARWCFGNEWKPTHGAIPVYGRRETLARSASAIWLFPRSLRVVFARPGAAPGCQTAPDHCGSSDRESSRAYGRCSGMAFRARGYLAVPGGTLTDTQIREYIRQQAGEPIVDDVDFNRRLLKPSSSSRGLFT